MKGTSFWGVSSSTSLGHHRTIQLLQHYWSGHRSWLDYYDIEWSALETNRDHSVVFEVHPSTAFQTLLWTVMATSFLLRDSFPQ